jgi:hypothetical protein
MASRSLDLMRGPDNFQRRALEHKRGKIAGFTKTVQRPSVGVLRGLPLGQPRHGRREADQGVGAGEAALIPSLSRTRQDLAESWGDKPDAEAGKVLKAYEVPQTYEVREAEEGFGLTMISKSKRGNGRHPAAVGNKILR